jgi:hypothetical protein
MYFASARDALADTLVLCEFLTAQEYVLEIMHSRHPLTRSDAKSRAKSICSHVRTALAYVNQALSGPPDVAFLPAYYAILNLAKVYILFGPYYARLAENRWHGVIYRRYAKASQKLPTERITLQTKGAIPLFYETVTRRQLTSEIELSMETIYSFIADIGFEWQLASGKELQLVGVAFDVERSARDSRPIARFNDRSGKRIDVDVRRVKVLRHFRRRAPKALEFRGGRVVGGDDDIVVRMNIEPHLLYYPIFDKVTTPLWGSQRLLMIEEIPIALMFFHMGSVVRYNPEFLARLRDSRFWAVVAAARWHGLYKFLLLFWSFVQQRTVIPTTQEVS